MEEIKEQVIELLDSLTENLSKVDYKDLLEDIVGDLESRISAAEEEMEDE